MPGQGASVDARQAGNGQHALHRRCDCAGIGGLHHLIDDLAAAGAANDAGGVCPHFWIGIVEGLDHRRSIRMGVIQQ